MQAADEQTHRGPPILDDPRVVDVLFHPRPDTGPNSGPDLKIPVTDTITLGANLYLAQESSPVIVLFHGNGEVASDYAAIAELYVERNITLMVVDYRGYGFSGGEPTGSALLRDARAAFHHVLPQLQDFGMSTQSMFVMGRSLGSAAAIEIASSVRHNLAGLIIESGFAYTFPLIQRL